MQGAQVVPGSDGTPSGDRTPPHGAVRLLLIWGPRAAGLCAAATGAAYLGAWSIQSVARWSAVGAQTMKANVAAALLLAGLSLVLLEPSKASRRRRAVGALLAVSVVSIGVVTLVERVLSTDLGIDRLLAPTARPERIGPPGSICLMLLGVGLVVLAQRRRIASLFGLATAVILLVPAVGLTSGVAHLYGEVVTGIAWPTLIALLLLAVGLHLAEARDGAFGLVWRDDPAGKFLRIMLPAAVLAPIALEMLVRLGRHHGLYDRPIGVGILLISFILVMSTLLWWSAARIGAEAARAKAMEVDARWRADLLDVVHDAILVWSPERGIEGWNKGAEELYGFTFAEAKGQNPHELLTTEPSSAMASAEEELERTGSWEGELRHRTRDGRAVVVSCKLRLVRGVDGLARVLETNRDITGRKRMEDELRESNRQKDQFLGLLSHELRNPLAPIANSLYILNHAELNGAQAGRAKEVMGRQVSHLTRLVDDLLDVTRITRGKVQLRRDLLDLGDLVRRSGEDHRDLLQRRGLEFTIEVPGRPLWIDGDETRIAQIIGNLLHNAAKFTQARGKVSLAVVAAEGMAEIHVRDTGAGIEKSLIDRIFDPFVQAEQTLARTEGGLGLGLALVKGVAELHGGSVEARSGGEGRGAEFVVRLPTVEAPGLRRERANGASAGAGAPVRRLRILVVDDNVDAAEALAEIVRMFGHEAEVALDGPAAIRMAAAERPDLILCDIGLPGMSGYEVARALRADPNLRATRLVAVSGYAQPEDVQRAAEAGFAGHIAKPAEPKMIERFLSTP